MWRLGWQVGTSEGRQSQLELRFRAPGEDPDQFAGWFGQTKSFAIPFAFQRQYRRKIYLETIEGVDPVYQRIFSLGEAC